MERCAAGVGFAVLGSPTGAQLQVRRETRPVHPDQGLARPGFDSVRSRSARAPRPAHAPGRQVRVCSGPVLTAVRFSAAQVCFFRERVNTAQISHVRRVVLTVIGVQRPEQQAHEALV